MCHETSFLNKLKNESSQVLQDSDTHNKDEIFVSKDVRASKFIFPNAVHSVYGSSSVFEQETFGT
jgi:hypothetical protein